MARPASEPRVSDDAARRPPPGLTGSTPGTPVQPAATVVLLRDVPGGVEVLMLRRTSAVAFGGMWVFPGGRVDPVDHRPPASGRRDRATAVSVSDADSVREAELAAARQAASREAAEEAGLEIPAERLVPLALWTPPPEAPRRYRTWFFIAPGSGGAVAVDGSEIDAHAWLAPGDALARHRRGEIELAPPTWVTLWQLAGDDEVAVRTEALVAAAAARPAEVFSTRMASDGQRVAALWEGDAGYDSGALDVVGERRRLWLAPGPWRLEWPQGRPLVGLPLQFP